MDCGLEVENQEHRLQHTGAAAVYGMLSAEDKNVGDIVVVILVVCWW